MTTRFTIFWSHPARLLFSLLLALFQQRALAQDADPAPARPPQLTFGQLQQRQLAFGRALPDLNLPAYAEGQILKEGVLWKTLKGADIEQLVYAEPGRYTLHLYLPHQAHSGACQHPDETRAIALTVQPLRCELVWDEALWWSLFSTQKNYQDFSVRVPVRLRTYGSAPQPLTGQLTVMLSGVDCTLTGVCDLSSQPPATDGDVRTLTFRLNGTVGSGVYTQLNYTDACGHTAAFGILKPLN
jgi:hypothetical protein